MRSDSTVTYLKMEPTKVSDGFDVGFWERRVKDDSKSFGLSNFGGMEFPPAPRRTDSAGLRGVG